MKIGKSLQVKMNKRDKEQEELEEIWTRRGRIRIFAWTPIHCDNTRRYVWLETVEMLAVPTMKYGNKCFRASYLEIQ